MYLLRFGVGWYENSKVYFFFSPDYIPMCKKLTFIHKTT